MDVVELPLWREQDTCPAYELTGIIFTSFGLQDEVAIRGDVLPKPVTDDGYVQLVKACVLYEAAPPVNGQDWVYQLSVRAEWVRAELQQSKRSIRG